MKNLFKIGALSLALVASLFLLNRTNATVPGDVSLEITGVTGHCLYGTSVYMGTTPFSTTATNTLSTGFKNTSGTAIRYCEDSEGDDSWELNMSASGLVNGSIDTIANTNVYLTLPTQEQVYSGNACGHTSDFVATTPKAIDTAQTIFGKSGTVLQQTCTIGINSLTISVAVPPYKAIGMYTGVLTLDIPSFDGVSN